MILLLNLRKYREKFELPSFGEKSQLYKTESGSYILDYPGNKIDDVAEDPILLVQEKDCER